MAGAAFALVALLYVGFAPLREPPATMVAVLTDAQAEPSILISWTPAQAAKRQVSVRILTHPDMAPATAWEAWLLPADNTPPVSLGLITNDINQTLQVAEASARVLNRAIAIGVSVEPKGGSVTGRPTEPFLLKGRMLRF
ncbi:MAG: anti-sigma factor [Betaproteobacteria bacterium]|nr:anti-sigma factor [Betaproteobacteria bacterium]